MSGEKGKTPPWEAPQSAAKGRYRNGVYPDTQGIVTTLPEAVYTLWVDPRHEPGYEPRRFDLAVFLGRAVALFRTKERWGGRAPDVVLAHPEHAGNGLKPAAAALGLAVVSDPTVTPGTYRLGVQVAPSGGGGDDATD